MTTATVKYAAGPPKEYEHGPRINVLCVLPTGEEVRIYDKPDSAIASWKKGQSVTLEKNEKGYWNPAKGQAAQAPAQQAPQAPAPALTRIDLDNEEQRAAMLKRGQHLADIYREVMRRLAEGDPTDPLDTFRVREEDLQAATATVFISLFRHA